MLEDCTQTSQTTRTGALDLASWQTVNSYVSPIKGHCPGGILTAYSRLARKDMYYTEKTVLSQT